VLNSGNTPAKIILALSGINLYTASRDCDSLLSSHFSFFRNFGRKIQLIVIESIAGAQPANGLFAALRGKRLYKKAQAICRGFKHHEYLKKEGKKKQ